MDRSRNKAHYFHSPNMKNDVQVFVLTFFVLFVKNLRNIYPALNKRRTSWDFQKHTSSKKKFLRSLRPTKKNWRKKILKHTSSQLNLTALKLWMIWQSFHDRRRKWNLTQFAPIKTKPNFFHNFTSTMFRGGYLWIRVKN